MLCIRFDLDHRRHSAGSQSAPARYRSPVSSSILSPSRSETGALLDGAAHDGTVRLAREWRVSFKIEFDPSRPSFRRSQIQLRRADGKLSRLSGSRLMTERLSRSAELSEPKPDRSRAGSCERRTEKSGAKWIKMGGNWPIGRQEVC